MTPRIVSRALCAAFFIVIACAPALVRAQDAPTPAPSATPIAQIAHVYTSDRSNETLKDAARTTYVVTKAEILRNGYRTVGDALAHLPGVEIGRYGAIGSLVSYGIRGSSSAQVLVLIDGLPAPGSLADSVDLGVLPTSDVTRIEVVEGGGSTLYGTGAIGGIVNIITDGQRAGTHAALRVGSFDDREVRLETHGFSFERIVANNDYGLPDGTTRNNADYEATSAHLGFDRTLGSLAASLRAGITTDRLGAPGPIGFLSTTSRENDLNADANLSLVRRTPNAETTLQFGGTNQHISFGCDAVNDPNCYLPQTSYNTEGRVDFGIRSSVGGDAQRLVYGADLSRGVVRSDSGGTASPPTSTNAFAQAALYAQESLQTRGGSRFYAGVRAERDGALGGALSPSFGFLAHLSNEASLKGNLAGAFRAPDASELYFPGYGNPALRPERAQVADLTLVDAHVLGGASLGWFSNRINDLIVPVLVDPKNYVYQPENIDRTLIEGFTFEIATHPLHGITTSLNLTDLYRAQDLTAQTRLPHDPVFSVNLQLGYRAGARSPIESAGIALRSVGPNGFVNPAQPLYDQAAAFTSLSAYVRVRLGAQALLTLRGENLGNERYAELSGYPLPGRAFALELSSH